MADELDYSAAGVPVRDDLRETHRAFWTHLRSPGAWWTGHERLAIAAAARRSLSCRLCRARRDALSPNAVAGEHDSDGELDPHAVEAIHRVRTDPARLSRMWFDSIVAAGMSVERYVELVGVVSLMAGVDSFARALGIPPFPLPEPISGAPSRYRPASAKLEDAWVPMIAAEDATGTEADLYDGAMFVPNILRALSVVPDEVRVLKRAAASHYVPFQQIPDTTVRRALDRSQMELVAARVSALNECFY
jgi:alkylhydroperoxidase family enzyme